MYNNRNMDKQQLILAFDIGNTNIKTAVFDGDSLCHEWRISTDPKRTGDEYFSILNTLFRDAGVRPETVTDTVLSAVVPALIGPFVTVTQHLTGRKPLVIAPEMYSRLPVGIPATAVHEIGTDLLCDAVGAWCRYRSPCIVADFGTALSFTAVDRNADIAGVAIAPGIRTAFNSLFSSTAQVPAVPLEIPSTSLGRNTTAAVQAGIVLGYRGLVESLIGQMRDDLQKETGTPPEKVKVIATGGLNSMLRPITDVFDFIDRDLTLFGMKMALDSCRTN